MKNLKMVFKYEAIISIYGYVRRGKELVLMTYYLKEKNNGIIFIP